MAQTLPPNFTRILTFTSPFVVAPAPPYFQSGGPNYRSSSPTPAWAGISSVGSARYLILTINGQRQETNLTTNIITTRSSTNVSRVTTTTNITTNSGSGEYGGIFIFAMNPATRPVSSAVPVYTNTNGLHFYGEGVWNLSNSFALSYNQAQVITNRVIGTNFIYLPGGTNPVAVGETNTTIYLDKYAQYHSLILTTTNNGLTWAGNSVAGSGIANYLSDNSTWNPDLTNNYRVVTRWIPANVVGGVTNRRIVCDVYRFP